MNRFSTSIEQAESRVTESLSLLGPLRTYRELLAANDARIRDGQGRLDDGRAIAVDRTAIHTVLMRDWAAAMQQKHGYAGPFAVVALGGTGRAELAPASDLDFSFLFEAGVEGNDFLRELQRESLHTDAFAQRCGFRCAPLPFSLDDLPSLDGKQLNSFLDLRPVYDPMHLAATFRQRVRDSFDSFEHFVHLRRFWLGQWEKAARESERLDRFDIKNDALRVFLAAVWALAGQRFDHAHVIYEARVEPDVITAYDFLLRIRAFVHLRRQNGRFASSSAGDHPEDILAFDDFTSFGELLGAAADERTRFEFANAVRARLLSARRRIAQWARGVVEGEIRSGRVLRPGANMTLGPGGLRLSRAAADGSSERSRAALGLLLAAQHYGVPVDAAELQTTFASAERWLVLVPEFAQLFYETRGNLAASLEFLSQIDGAMERLCPGYSQFECSLDPRVIAERRVARGALLRAKLETLGGWVREGGATLARLPQPPEGVEIPVEAALLDQDGLAAVKFALLVKRLPFTADDSTRRADRTRPLHERYSSGFSGIPLPDYFAPFAAAGFPEEMLRLAEFLIAQRRAFRDRTDGGLNDHQQVAEFARLAGDEPTLRALFVFTCADLSAWESATLSFNRHELYLKTRQLLRPAGDAIATIRSAGYSEEQVEVLRDFGDDFFRGVYRQYANRFGSHLVRLAEDSAFDSPRAALLREGASLLLGIAARDYRGLAATITGELYRRRMPLSQAHLFSASRYGLALDFFHLAPSAAAVSGDLPRQIEEAVRRRLHIGDEDATGLPALPREILLGEWRPGLYCLRCSAAQEDNGLIHALAYTVYRHLRGDIYGLTAHARRGRTFLSVYHSLPPDLLLPAARQMLQERR